MLYFPFPLWYHGRTMRRSQSIQDNLAPNHTAYRLLFDRLNERDQRHVAGFLALTIVGNITGLCRDTVPKRKGFFDKG